MEMLEEIRRGELEPRNLPPIQVCGFFSACGRRCSFAAFFYGKRIFRFTSIRRPTFQVLVGPDENDGLGPWYVFLNNQRLWVLKQCHREGLLDNKQYSNSIAVRIRALKGGGEAQRYTVDNCSLEAKFTREGKGGGGSKKKGAHKKKGAVVPSEMDGHSDGDGNFDTIIEDSASKNTPSYPSGHVMRRDEVGNENNETAHDSDDDSDSDSDDSVAHLNPCSALL